MSPVWRYLKHVIFNSPLPSGAWDPSRSDGCTLWPDGDWRPCCVEHDEAYFRGGSWTERLEADTQLFLCVVRAGHPVMAAVMFAGVQLLAGPVWPHAGRWGHGRRYRDSFLYRLQKFYGK